MGFGGGINLDELLVILVRDFGDRLAMDLWTVVKKVDWNNAIWWAREDLMVWTLVAS